MTLKELLEKLQAAIMGGVSEDAIVHRLGNGPPPQDVLVVQEEERVYIMPARIAQADAVRLAQSKAAVKIG